MIFYFQHILYFPSSIQVWHIRIFYLRYVIPIQYLFLIYIYPIFPFFLLSMHLHHRKNTNAERRAKEGVYNVSVVVRNDDNHTMK